MMIYHKKYCDTSNKVMMVYQLNEYENDLFVL